MKPVSTPQIPVWISDEFSELKSAVVRRPIASEDHPVMAIIEQLQGTDMVAGCNVLSHPYSHREKTKMTSSLMCCRNMAFNCIVRSDNGIPKTRMFSFVTCCLRLEIGYSGEHRRHTENENRKPSITSKNVL